MPVDFPDYVLVRFPSSALIQTFLVDSKNTTVKLVPGEDCVRDCKVGEPPKFCYYKFKIEFYVTQGHACDLCEPTDMFNSTCQCITGDGFERTMLSVNRMLPGPSIQVCADDRVIVDVQNEAEGADTTIHWHGVVQRGTQYYDGVPMVTQCPIHSGTTFRYQMVTEAGTFFYHSHVGVQRFDGVFGSMIARQPKSQEPNGHLYDHDLPEHVVFINEWMHVYAVDKFPGLRSHNVGQEPKSLLINGRGKWTNPRFGNTTTSPLATFTVKKGQRYRFRLINAMTSPCGCGLRIQDHNMTVIGSDVAAVEPKGVDTIHSYSGERYDFVLDANQEIGEYWMQFWASDLCLDDRIQQFAILKYEGAESTSLSKQPTFEDALKKRGLTLNPPLETCSKNLTDGVCYSSLRSVTTDDKELLKKDPDVKIHLNYTFVLYQPQELFGQNSTYRRFVVLGGQLLAQAYVKGYSYSPASAPLINQYSDVEQEVCGPDKPPTGCNGNCSCTNVIKVPLNAVVEIILIDETPFHDVHAFHLHGHAFKVLGMGIPQDLNVTSFNVTLIRQLDEKGLIKRNFDHPPCKDTIAVPDGGYSIIRFRADNPGFWLLHCHFDVHLSVGMGAVIQVGELEDLPPVPEDFPTCGNYIPDNIDPTLCLKQ